MLTVQDLHVRRGTTAAVRGVDLTVADGELVTLVGPNGAGKTSLLRSLAGLEKSSTGRVTYRGRVLLPGRIRATANAGIGLVPEGRRIFAPLTVHENLVLGATLRPAKDVARDVRRWIDRFPVLGHRLHTPAGSLSGGEQQMLAIARALMARPSLLLLDEPSLGLAPLVLDSVFEVLAELHGDGLSILLVEQSARRAMALADRAYVMANGRIQASGTAGELTGDSLLHAYFGSGS